MTALKEFKKSQTVFYQDEEPTCSYRISKGLVRAYIIHENGEEATIAFFGPGDIFPVAYPFAIAPVAMFYYDTVVDTTCEYFHDDELMDELVKDAREELRRFAKRYAGALLHVASLAQNSAYEKVAHTLQYLAIRFGEALPDGRHYKISLRLTQHDLAKLCNISRETASIELGMLRSRDIISERDKHYIVHMGKLNAVAGDDNAAPIEL